MKITVYDADGNDPGDSEESDSISMSMRDLLKKIDETALVMESVSRQLTSISRRREQRRFFARMRRTVAN